MPQNSDSIYQGQLSISSTILFPEILASRSSRPRPQITRFLCDSESRAGRGRSSLGRFKNDKERYRMPLCHDRGSTRYLSQRGGRGGCHQFLVPSVLLFNTLARANGHITLESHLDQENGPQETWLTQTRGILHPALPPALLDHTASQLPNTRASPVHGSRKPPQSAVWHVPKQIEQFTHRY